MHDHSQEKNGPGALGKNAEPVSPNQGAQGDRVALERAADKAHLEYLVAEVASQLLAVPLPGFGSDAEAMIRWSTDRARNVLMGLAGERL
jgi:hypothetical protein